MKVAIEINARSVTEKVAGLIGIAEHNWLKEEEYFKGEISDIARDLKIEGLHVLFHVRGSSKMKLQI
jgi:hypothetical protein